MTVSNGVSISRRTTMLAAAGLGCVALVKAGGAAATEVSGTPTEKANAKVVRDFLKMWGEQSTTATAAMAAATENCVVRLSPTAKPWNNRAEAIAGLDNILKSGQRFHMTVVDLLARGSVVTTYRSEIVSAPGKPDAPPFTVTSVFIMEDGKIKEWMDYPLPKT